MFEVTYTGKNGCWGWDRKRWQHCEKKYKEGDVGIIPDNRLVYEITLGWVKSAKYIGEGQMAPQIELSCDLKPNVKKVDFAQQLKKTDKRFLRLQAQLSNLRAENNKCINAMEV